MKYYVFELIDPRNHKPFYIGKNAGTPLSESILESAGISRMPKDMHADIVHYGSPVTFHIVAKNLDTDPATLLQEALIEKYGKHNVINFLVDEPPTKYDKYSTIQVRRNIKDQIKHHCDKRGLFISKYIEQLFLADVSGSAIL